MATIKADGSVMLDELDRQIMRGLQLDPRAPFSRLGAVLGVSEQTVARRYRWLRREGLLRVVAAVNPRALGLTDWMVRVRCRPDAAPAVAKALARRDDVSWVTVSSGGWEVLFDLRARTDADREQLLERLLPKSAPVLDVAAAAILRAFVGGDASDWQGWRDALTPEQAGRIAAPRNSPARGGARVDAELTAADHVLLDRLARDGRAGYPQLARASGLSVGRVTRRIAALQAAGVVYFDMDFAPAATGHPTNTTVWLTVLPNRIEAVGSALAAHSEVPFAAAITGRANLMASVVTRDLDDLYRYVTTRLAAVDGITGYELSPQLRRTKQAGALLSGDRLAAPA